MKHTPGPWAADVRGGYAFVEPKICKIRNNKKELSNARLIAAAPDMLSALYAAEDLLLKASTQFSCKSWTPVYAAIQRAIAKAEGEK